MKTDINELIYKAYNALTVSAINGYDQWEDELDDIVFDLMSFNEDFEGLSEEEVRMAVTGALAKYENE